MKTTIQTKLSSLFLSFPMFIGLLFFNLISFTSFAVMPCTSPTANTGTTTITPTTTWQTVVFNSGAVRYIEFTATTGNSYVFTCNTNVSGSASGLDEQFSILNTSNTAAGGVYATSYKDTYASGTKERIIWSPSSNGTYRIVVSEWASSTDCQALTANMTVAYTTFSGTQNFAFWTGFSSTTYGTGANWFRRGTTGYPSESTSTATDNTTIPSGSSNQPNCGDVQAATLDLTINSGATLSMSYNVNALYVDGDLTNNGTINHTGTIYIYLWGASHTIGGTGDFYGGTACPINIQTGASYTLQNNLTLRHLYVDGGTLDLNGYDVSTEFFFQDGPFYLGEGTLSIWGGHDASSWANPGDNINPYFTTSGNFYPETGTVFYCQGDTYTANDQKIRTTTYYNLKINTQSTKTATIGTAATTTVSNDLTILNSSTAGGVATTAYDITVGNNLYIGNTGNALTLNLANRMYRASGTGTLTMGNVATHAINVTYADASNYAISGFGASPTFYGIFTYNSASAQKVIPATYYDFVSTGTGTKTLFGNIDINGDITLSNGSLAQSTFDINVAENWTGSGNYFTEGTGTVTFDGTAVTTITNTTATYGGVTGYSLLSEDFENSGSMPAGWTESFDDGTVSYAFSDGAHSGSISAAHGGSYNAKLYHASNSAYDTYLISPVIDFTGYTTNPTLTFWHGQEAWSGDQDELRVYYKTSSGGAWTLLATYTSSVSSWTKRTISLPAVNSTYYIGFLGLADFGYGLVIDDVEVTGDSGTAYTGEAFNKFAINKTGGGSVTLSDKILIQTSLTFTDGLITSTSSNYPEFDEDATVAGTPSATCHVNGEMIKNTNSTTAFTFPCGDGTSYRAMKITPSGSGATIWTAKYFSSAYSDLTVTGINHVSSEEYWTLDRAGASPTNATIQLTWDANSFVDSDFSDLVVAHFDGTDWETAGGNSHTGNATAGTVDSDAAWSSYSPFTLGSATGIVPLPIELVSFKAEAVNNTVLTSWITSSEINNDYFTVERSNDGITFEPIGRVEGAGNSNYELHYSLIDNDFQSGINYYRLEQTDYDGKTTYSEIESVNLLMDDKSVIMTVNALGQKVQSNYTGLVFDIHPDGSSTKRIQ